MTLEYVSISFGESVFSSSWKKYLFDSFGANIPKVFCMNHWFHCKPDVVSVSISPPVRYRNGCELLFQLLSHLDQTKCIKVPKWYHAVNVWLLGSSPATKLYPQNVERKATDPPATSDASPSWASFFATGPHHCHSHCYSHSHCHCHYHSHYHYHYYNHYRTDPGNRCDLHS